MAKFAQASLDEQQLHISFRIQTPQITSLTETSFLTTSGPGGMVCQNSNPGFSNIQRQQSFAEFQGRFRKGMERVIQIRRLAFGIVDDLWIPLGRTAEARLLRILDLPNLTNFLRRDCRLSGDLRERVAVHRANGVRVTRLGNGPAQS